MSDPVVFSPCEIGVLSWVERALPAVTLTDVCDVSVDERALASSLGVKVKSVRLAVLDLDRLGVWERGVVSRGRVGYPRPLRVSLAHPAWDWLRAYRVLCAQAARVGDRPERPARRVGLPVAVDGGASVEGGA